MLREIDSVMIRVEDVDVSAAYYAKVFGLRPKWSGGGAVGLVFPESDAEIVLHCEATIPSSVEVHYLVDTASVPFQHVIPFPIRYLVDRYGAGRADQQVSKCFGILVQILVKRTT
jgi:hypothetical protein